MTAPNIHEVGNPQPEPAAPGSSSGDGGGIEDRLARLETRIEYLATKEDIQKLKVWVLGGVLVAMGLGAGIVLGILRIFP